MISRLCMMFLWMGTAAGCIWAMCSLPNIGNTSWLLGITTLLCVCSSIYHAGEWFRDVP